LEAVMDGEAIVDGERAGPRRHAGVGYISRSQVRKRVVPCFCLY
jgi:hypothetical protein